MGKLLFDQYSLLHFATGVVAYFIGIKWWLWLIIHILFELIENTSYGIALINKYMSFFWPGKKRKADSIINQVGDTISSMIGWLCAYLLDKLGKKNRWYKRH